MRLPVALFAALGLLGAVAPGPGSFVSAQPAQGGEAASAPRSPGRNCFWPRNVQRFRSVNNRTVYVRTSARDVWALELFSSCLGVDWARRASLRTRGGGTICEGRATFAEIEVRTRAGGRQRCSVRNVRRLSQAEVANLPPRARP